MSSLDLILLLVNLDYTTVEGRQVLVRAEGKDALVRVKGNGFLVKHQHNAEHGGGNPDASQDVAGLFQLPLLGVLGQLRIIIRFPKCVLMCVISFISFIS